MNRGFSKTPIALAVAAALGAAFISTAPGAASAAKTPGTYVSGDFHNHTTCSDGSISMQKLVKKATDTEDTPWGLDWFVQAGHGGNGNRNCTLVEDATLDTPAYPYLSGDTPFNTATPPAKSQYDGPRTTWAQSIGATNIKGSVSGSGATQNMWRWQSVQEFQYPIIEYLSALKNVPLFIGVETVVPGHEHTSMSVITGQIPQTLDQATLPITPGYTALGSAAALAQWEYCFDRNDTDKSRGNPTVGTVSVPGGNNWDCSVPGSLNSSDPSWDLTARKLIPAGGTGTGNRGHGKTLEALKWMVAFHPNDSYYVPAHLERAGPFNPNGNNGFNIEHLRDFNNTAPNVAFGFETQPGHGASSERGEYYPARNNIGGVLVDSVGGTTYGGTGIYGAQIGGVWDALLGEGRNWWFFASSDWHNRGLFGPDDRRSAQDFYPGEYQRDYVMVRHGTDKIRPPTIVDGLRSGNSFTTSGQLIDRLAFIACASYSGLGYRSNAAVENAAANAALSNTDIDIAGCATMGEKLKVRPGAEVVVSIVVHDPDGTNYSPYSFPNPSLVQIRVDQPLNAPVLDHVDVIRGLVTTLPKQSTDPNYAGAWPNTWLSNPDMNTVPAAAKNPTATLYKTFSATSVDPTTRWATVAGDAGFKKMTFRIPAVSASQYVRLRGTNLPPAVPFETDANGNPLPDLHTNATTTNAAAGQVGTLKIPCTTVGTNMPAVGTSYPAGLPPIDGCPSHLPTINGTTYVAYDVAAWSDLWFYSNPIYIEVGGSTLVAGVK